MNRTIAVGVPVVLILVLAGWVSAKRNEEAAAKLKAESTKKVAPITVELVSPRAATIQKSVNAIGSLDSPFTVKLSPNIAGRIDYLQVREGDEVHSGQILAQIDPAQVEGQILAARAAVAQAQHNLAQAKITQGANSVGIYSTINQDKAAVASAQADYNEAVVTYEATVAAAHEATVDAQSKVRSASAQAQSSQANLELAQANLQDAKAKYTREYSLYTQALVAPQDVDDAKATMKVDQATVQANDRLVQAAKSALESANQEEKEAENQETITRKKGLSNIQDVKSVLTQSQATLKTATANRSQIPAYVANLNALQAQVEAAQGTLDQAIAQRAFLTVKSSIDGTVTQRLADPGAEASPGSQILVVQYLKWLYLDAYVSGEFADEVKVGSSVKISLDAFPGKVFSGAISDINKAIDPMSHQFMVRIKLQNPDSKFRPGMYARIDLVGSLVRAKVAVPTRAVNFATNGSATVTTVDDKNLAHIVSVLFGAQDKRHVEITSGLTTHDKVVLATESPLSEETLVKEGKVVKKTKATADGTTTSGGASANPTLPTVGADINGAKPSTATGTASPSTSPSRVASPAGGAVGDSASAAGASSALSGSSGHGSGGAVGGK